MVRFLRAFTLCLLLAAGPISGAAAQSEQKGAAAPPAPKPIEAVTVIGKRRTEREMIKTFIAPFVMQHAARDPKTGLIVRGPPEGVCPVTTGLSEGFDDFVTARIVEVAHRVGAVVQPAGKCRPNVQVAFTLDAQGLVDRLAEKSGGAMLGFHFAGQERALVQVSRPIQAWYVTGTVNAVPSSYVQIFGVDGRTTIPGTVAVDRSDGAEPYSGLGSKLTPGNSSQIMSVLIVADLDKLDGHEIGPVSDYIAMLALSQMRSLDACSELPSILDLMASDCPARPAPQALTEGDMAFLKALYAADITLSGARGRDRIEHGMVKALEGAGP